jgi:Flp pilus assembly protein TadD
VTAAAPKPVPQAAKSAAADQAAGRKLLEDGKFAEAIAPLSEAIELDPTAARAYNARGYAHLRLRHFTEAASDFDHAIRIDPNYVNAYQNRSVARRGLGDTAGSNADLEKSRELSQGQK